jgi:hypothetical protein
MIFVEPVSGTKITFPLPPVIDFPVGTPMMFKLKCVPLGAPFPETGFCSSSLELPSGAEPQATARIPHTIAIDDLMHGFMGHSHFSSRDARDTHSREQLPYSRIDNGSGGDCR